MDGFACSSWYFLRFTSPHYDAGPFEPRAMQHWMPVDSYVGGAEHAVLHLLYARFWTKVMYDAGLLQFQEPFAALRSQGVLRAANGQRMSKSRGNVVTPDEVIEKHGTDALRAYVLFLGPFDADVVWDPAGIKGIERFLTRVWALANHVPNQANEPSHVDCEALERVRHRTIARVTWDLEHFHFNTVVSALMEYANYLSSVRGASLSLAQWRTAIETLSLLLAPICPFIAEEVWQKVLGHRESVHRQRFPTFDAAQIVEQVVTLAVQVNGKVRDHITLPADADEHVARERALQSPVLQRALAGKVVRAAFFVPRRLLNLVTG
jgi:leucyl-tRNA synthetase